MRHLKSILITVVLLAAMIIFILLGASTAPAYDWLPKFDAAAVSYWGHGQLPPCGEVRHEWAPESAVNASNPDARYITVARIKNADLSTCTVQWNQDQWPGLVINPDWMCAFDLHEIAHLYGKEHVKDPRNIMNAHLDDDLFDPMEFGPCRKSIKIHYWIDKRGWDRATLQPRN